MRYFIDIAYKGTHYHGWQVQPNAVTIQEKLNKAFQLILRDKTIYITGSGRTDTGVHAIQQIAHMDTGVELDEQETVYALNNYLPHDITLKSVTPVQEKAHARHDALSRKYEYHVCCWKNPFVKDLAYRYYKPLDINSLNEAAGELKKFEDFKSFSRVNTQVDHFYCRIDDAYWEHRDDCLVFVIKANRFLRGMVRGIVGTMLDVGRGKVNIDQFRQVIEARDREKAGENVPPEGLYLVSVEYPSSVFYSSVAN